MIEKLLKKYGKDVAFLNFFESVSLGYCQPDAMLDNYLDFAAINPIFISEVDVEKGD